jgi:polysaccharide biosynthesis/export protein
MFRVNDKNALKTQIASAEANYKIKKNDLLSLDIYTNAGEKIVDPNLESFKDASGGLQHVDPQHYLIDISGMAKLPLIHEIQLEGLTIRQAEDLLQKEYAKYYKEPFVVLKFTNKRVVVLGAPGGQVIPLLNENTRLTEALALAKGINMDGKAHNIRVLRGDVVFLADLSTIQGYLKNDIILLPGDIIYVEPVRRPLSEGLREYGPFISIVTSLGTLVLVILELNKP